MKQLSNTEAELEERVAYKKSVVNLRKTLQNIKEFSTYNLNK